VAYQQQTVLFTATVARIRHEGSSFDILNMTYLKQYDFTTQAYGQVPGLEQ